MTSTIPAAVDTTAVTTPMLQITGLTSSTGKVIFSEMLI